METAIARIEEQEHYGSWLNTTEENELKVCEEKIETFRSSGLEAGKALLIIRDKRLYRQTHKTFEAYLKDRWDIGDRYGRQLISAARLIENLQTGGITPVPNAESQALVITRNIKSPEKQREIWNKVVKQSEETGEKITARKVEQTVREYLEPAKSEPIIDVEPEPQSPPDEVKEFTSIFQVNDLIALGDQWGEEVFHQSKDDALDQVGFGLTGEDEGLIHWNEIQITWKFIKRGVK